MEQAVAQPLSERIQKLAESATIAMAQKAREFKAKGFDVISLSLGEPDFKTPQHIQNAAKAAIDEGKYFGYSPVPGYLDLRQAIADKLLRDNSLTYSPNQIVVSTGAKQSIANVFMCLLNPGDEVIYHEPCYVSYGPSIALGFGVPVPDQTKLEDNFALKAEAVETARDAAFLTAIGVDCLQGYHLGAPKLTPDWSITSAS